MIGATVIVVFIALLIDDFLYMRGDTLRRKDT